MARNSQKIIQLLRSSQVYQQSTWYEQQFTHELISEAEYEALSEDDKLNYNSTPVVLSALETAIKSFDAAFIQAAQPQDGEIMLARYQETGDTIKSVLAAYNSKNNESGFTFYLDSVAINDMLDDLSEQIAANTVTSEDGSIVIVPGDASNPTDISVNVDGTTMTKVQGALATNLAILKEDENTQGVTLDANVKEQYKLVYNGSTTAIGDVIKVYKDSSLIEVYLGTADDTIVSSTGVITKYAWQLIEDPTEKITNSAYSELAPVVQALYEAIDSQSLNFKYQLADGTYSLVKIDVTKFLTESEFGAGLKVQGGVVSLDVSGTVTVGRDVTYVAININNPDDKLKSSTYSKLPQQQKDGYYRYVNSNDPTDMITESAYNALQPEEQANYEPISILVQDVPTEVNVFNEENGVVDVDAIQEAIDFAAIEAQEGVRVSGSDAIRVDSGNRVYLILSDETDNVLEIETGANQGVYLSGTWDCGEY